MLLRVPKLDPKLSLQDRSAAHGCGGFRKSGIFYKVPASLGCRNLIKKPLVSNWGCNRVLHWGFRNKDFLISILLMQMWMLKLWRRLASVAGHVGGAWLGRSDWRLCEL